MVSLSSGQGVALASEFGRTGAQTSRAEELGRGSPLGADTQVLGLVGHCTVIYWHVTKGRNESSFPLMFPPPFGLTQNFRLTRRASETNPRPVSFLSESGLSIHIARRTRSSATHDYAKASTKRAPATRTSAGTSEHPALTTGLLPARWRRDAHIHTHTHTRDQIAPLHFDRRPIT